MEVVNAVLKTKDNGTGRLPVPQMQNCYKLPSWQVSPCRWLQPQKQLGQLLGWKNSFWVRAVQSILGWWLMWEVEPEAETQDVWLPVKAQLHPPSFIGQKKTGHVKDEVELRQKRFVFSSDAGKDLERAEEEKYGRARSEEIKSWTHSQC